MKRVIPSALIAGGTAALLIIAGQAFRTSSTSPAATATRAAVTSTVTTATSTSTLAAPPLQPQTAAAQQTTEEAWPARKTQTEIQTTNTTAFVQPQAATAQTPWTRKIGVQPAKAKSTSPPQGDSSLPSNPYANSMFDPAVAQPTSLTAATTIRAAVRSSTATTYSPPIPVPDWTRCTTSWAVVEAPSASGMLSWVFTTTLSTEDQQDLATAVRWWADIQKNHADVARNMAWIDCGGFRVRDWRLHAAPGQSPIDFYGMQGLDSPLGTCHDRTPFRNIGVWKGTIGEDGKLRGWVRYHGKFYLGTATDATCTTDCSAEFDHPCELPIEEFPFVMFDRDNKPYYSWWVGGDPAKEPQ